MYKQNIYDDCYGLIINTMKISIDDQLMHLSNNFKKMGINTLSFTENVTKKVFLDAFDQLDLQQDKISKEKKNFLFLVINSFADDNGNLVTSDFSENGSVDIEFIQKKLKELNFMHVLLIFSGNNADFKDNR